MSERRRSEHSEQRRREGRRTGPAFTDAQRATRAQVAWDTQPGRFVVRGPLARYHVLDGSGVHVTQVSYTAKTWLDRHATGRWVALTDEQWEKFRALLQTQDG